MRNISQDVIRGNILLMFVSRLQCRSLLTASSFSFEPMRALFLKIYYFVNLGPHNVVPAICPNDI